MGCGLERGNAYSVKEKGLFLLVAVEDGMEVTVRKEDTASEKMVGLHADDLLEAFQELIVDQLCAEFLDEFLRAGISNDSPFGKGPEQSSHCSRWPGFCRLRRPIRFVWLALCAFHASRVGLYFRP